MNIEQFEAVQDRKLEHCIKQMNERLFDLGKHEAIREIKLKLLLINRSKNTLIHCKKVWQILIIITNLYQLFRSFIKVFSIKNPFFSKKALFL